MNPTKLIIIGGFLGAGKTSLILALAKKLIAGGKKIAVITNDQSSDLVDTEYLIANGLGVLAVEGSCFCCNFDEFASKIAQQQSRADLDVILCEPVGSCTDLIATIFKPLAEGKAAIGSFRLAPFTVTADAKRVLRLMENERRGELTEVNYLCRKQLEEAAVISLGKADLYDGDTLARCGDYIRSAFPGAKLLCTSAADGTNLDALLAELGGGFDPLAAPSLELDYDRYAAAEAELGWCNISARLTNASPAQVPLAPLVRGYMRNAAARLPGGSMTAHFKCHIVTAAGFFKASMVETGGEILISGDEGLVLPEGGAAGFIINARIAASPDALLGACTGALDGTGVLAEVLASDCFSPARPSPTYRM